MRGIRLAVLPIIALLLAAATPDSRRQSDQCRFYDEHGRLRPGSNPDLAIAACTTLKHEYDRAIEDYDQAIRLDPNLAAAFTNRGAVYTEKQEYDRAMQDLDRAIELDPDDALAFNNRATVHHRQRSSDHAIHDLDRAIEL